MIRPAGPAEEDLGSVEDELCFFAAVTRCGRTSLVRL